MDEQRPEGSCKRARLREDVGVRAADGGPPSLGEYMIAIFDYGLFKGLVARDYPGIAAMDWIALCVREVCDVWTPYHVERWYYNVLCDIGWANYPSLREEVERTGSNSLYCLRTVARHRYPDDMPMS